MCPTLAMSALDEVCVAIRHSRSDELNVYVLASVGSLQTLCGVLCYIMDSMLLVGSHFLLFHHFIPTTHTTGIIVELGANP